MSWCIFGQRILFATRVFTHTLLNRHLKAVLVVACSEKDDLRPARAGAKRNPSASRGHVGAFWPAVPASDDAIRSYSQPFGARC